MNSSTIINFCLAFKCNVMYYGIIFYLILIEHNYNKISRKIISFKVNTSTKKVSFYANKYKNNQCNYAQNEVK